MMDETYLIFSANYPPHIGGVERYSQGLARELVRRGKHAVIISSSMPGAAAESTEGEGIEVYRLPSKYFCGERMPILTSSSAWRRLSKKLLQYPSKKVLVQTVLYPLSLVGISFAHKHHLPCVVLSHSSNYVCLGQGLVDRFEHIYEQMLLKRAMKLTDHFYSVSEASAQWLAQQGCPTRGVLYNSVDDRAIQEILEAPGVSIRETYGIDPQAQVITFVGRLIREKGVLSLAEGFKKLLAQQENVELVIVGDGPLSKELEALNCSHIHCLGYQSHQQTIRILKESDCFCLPSDSEGFPTTVLEAVLSKCYVITAPYGGAKEIISSQAYGYVMPGNTPENIYQALQYFVSHGEDCRRAVHACYDRFFQGFTWQTTCNRLEAAFQNTAANP